MPYTAMTQRGMSAYYGVHESGVHVQFHAPLADDATDLLPGSVVHLDSNKEFAAGLDGTPKMPIFLFSDPAEPDLELVRPDPATDVGAWVPMVIPGQALGLVANGGYEIVSCAYEDTGDDDDYAPNTFLTSPSTGGNKGLLTIATRGTHNVCGMVSRGVVDNGWGHAGLAFWTYVEFPAA